MSNMTRHQLTWWVSIELEVVLKGMFSNFEALAYLQGRLI